MTSSVREKLHSSTKRNADNITNPAHWKVQEAGIAPNYCIVKIENKTKTQGF